MAFKQKLQEKLHDDLSDLELNLIPKGFQVIGDIIILNLPEGLLKYKKKIADAVLELFPKIKSVCNKVSGVSGKYREPEIELLAGDKNTETIHLESGCKYKFDIRKLMFAKGNLSERIRVANQIKSSKSGSQEIIIDMFSGLGYFTIPNAKLGGPKKIYAIEWNPIACKYLKENLVLNKIQSIVEVIHGDSLVEVPKLIEQCVVADRIMLGLLPPPTSHIALAIKASKKGTKIHYDDLIRTEHVDEDVKKTLDLFNKAAKEDRKGFTVKLVSANNVKSYGPKMDHYVLDLEVC
jgi:tRNA wybutosine-synthesizing protein 2